MDNALSVRTRPRIDLVGLAPFLAVAAIVVALDQAAKAFIRARLAEGEWWPVLGDDLLRISHIENSGAAFGILQGASTFLLVATVLGVTAIAVYLILLPDSSSWYPFALALVLGGATGNLIDRLTRGTVTDFIDPTHYPAFNLADSSIFMGVAILILSSYLLPERETPGGARED